MTIDFALRLASLTAEPSSDAPGDVHRLGRVERTRTEMLVQGTASARTLQAEADAIGALAATIRERAPRRIVIAGCGDSWFIGQAVKGAVETVMGAPCDAVQALDFAHYGARIADTRTIVVGISAGGNTPAVMAALAQARQRGALAVGLSNTPASPILASFDAGLVVHASRKGWPTQSSTAAMALLVALFCEVAGTDAALGLRRELDRVVASMDATLASLDQAVAAAAPLCAARPIVLFAGLGPNAAAAAIGAAKVKELSPIHAVAMPLEEYHHYRSQKRGDPIVLVATDPASQERALDTALVAEKVGGPLIAVLSEPAPEIEARAAAVLRVPACSPDLAPLLSCLPLHLFAYHLARARDAIGLGAA